MKSTVEQLSPTRVRINVEVPFTELQPDFDRAYKELAKQVRLPGFRPGKAPAKLLEARVGREAMLDQVVNEALPSRYGQAVTESDVRPLGQPDIQVTKKEYGQELVFTAEVDVRPEITLPDLSSLKITVDPIKVGDEDVDAELQSLRARFGTLTGVERPAATGDFVSIDLSANIDGEDVPEASTKGLSHEVGSGQLVDGLDDAIVGLSAGESRTFTTTMAAGPHAGKEAEVTVTVGPVKERELPEPDDEFAQLASEFDTIDELRASLADQVSGAKRVQQAEEIRVAALDALLEQVDMPLPEAIVQAQVDNTLHSALHGLDHDEAKFAEALEKQGSSREEFDANTRVERREGHQDAVAAGRTGRRPRHSGEPAGPHRTAGAVVAAVRHRTPTVARLPPGEQSAAGDVRRRAARADHRRRGRGGDGHRHRRQRRRHRGVLRHALPTGGRE